MSKILCKKIGVDCVANDPVDIRCGGCDYLGFDFFVPKETVEEMKKFIVTALRMHEIPIIDIYETQEKLIDEENAWDKKSILKEILKEKQYLLHEESIRKR